MKHSRTYIQLSACLAGIAIILLLEKYTSWDKDLQEFFFNHHTGEWLISKETHQTWSWLFYSGLKYLTASIGISSLFILISSFFSLKLGSWRRPSIILLSSIILLPLTVSVLKKTTNICTPRQLSIYGGNYPNTPILDSYPQEFVQKKRVAGFPAGHSTAGFSLMALYFCFRTRKAKWAGLITGLSLGWIAGFYQMLRGEHFLSHTLVSMLISWIIILCLEAILPPQTGIKQSPAITLS